DTRRPEEEVSVKRTRQKSGRVTAVPVKPQPTVMHPVLFQLHVPAEEVGLPLYREHHEAYDTYFNSWEVTCGLTFGAKIRAALENIAIAWISHDRMLHSPRPVKFRKRLQIIERALVHLRNVIDLNKVDTKMLDRSLFLWLVDGKFNAAEDFLAISI